MNCGAESVNAGRSGGEVGVRHLCASRAEIFVAELVDDAAPTTMADVRAITADKLAGLDEDILDYIVGTIEDPDTPTDEAQEAVREFLLSTGFVETEEAAEARVAELFAALGGGAEPAPAEAPTNATPAKLEAQ